MEFFSKIFGRKPQIESCSIEQELANEIVTTSMVFVSSYIKNWPAVKQGGINLTRLVNEFIYFYLHMINRLAYSKGGKDAQELIYNCVVDHVGNKLMRNLDSDKRRIFIEIFSDGILETEKVYAKCPQLISEGVESSKDTLLWEAAKRVSQSEDIAEIMFVLELIFKGLVVLKLNDQVDQIINHG